MVVVCLLGFVRLDVRGCRRSREAGVGRLLQYWMQKAGALLASYPAATPACWDALVEVPVAAHAELELLAVAATEEQREAEDGGGVQAALCEALRGQVIPKALRPLVLGLSWEGASEDQLRVSKRPEGGEEL